jgi:di/tricarboxylate transporter
MMVIGPGGYQFNDYWKLGLPMLVWFSVIALVWVRWSGRSRVLCAPIRT